jgi:asparagine synthase (glutamine-hydrolysing)
VCGIAGYAGVAGGWPAGCLERMRDAMLHRGPDGAGAVRWREDGQPAAPEEPAAYGLAHRRLSIIDLSTAGAQPMSNEDRSLWITYNGEFYNFQDFRRPLEERGHVFRSHCDTETLLHLYEEHGLEETLARMNGMFAFGLWDTRRRELVLARDRAGKKPLYYAHLPDGSLLFASEMKALFAAGVLDRAQVDETALDQIWALGYTAGERTLHPQIRKLLPAHYLVWKDGRIRIQSYWDCRFGEEVWQGRPLEDMADELEALLEDAIRMRLIADVPVGLFLSGGIDSSLVAALAAKVTGRRVQSFTVGFPHAEFDETPFAEKVAAALGIDNRQRRIEEDVLHSADRIARQFDEPFGDSSAVPTWIVSKLARQELTVALTGDGGDEVFAGYDFQMQAVRIWGEGDQRRAFRRQLTLTERFWELRLRALGFRRGYPSLERRMPRRLRTALFDRAFLARNRFADVFADRWGWYDRVRSADSLSRMQYLMFKTWLPDDFLRKVDSMSMAHSLECRCPLLDHRVVEFAARIPFEAKITPGGRGKRLLRMILGRHVPAELFERPKRGFVVPWERLCQGAAVAQLREQWRARVRAPLQPDAADLLFPAEGEGSNYMKWTGFATLALMGAGPQD